MAKGVNKRLIILYLLGTIGITGKAQPLTWKTAVLTGAITLDSLTRYMNIHTDIRLTFNSGKVHGGRTVLFPGKTYDVNGLLLYIQQHTGLTWTLIGKHVIFRDDPHKMRAPAARKKPAPRVIGVHTRLARIDTTKREAVTIDTRIREKSLPLVQSSPPKENQAPEKKPVPSKWILRAGAFASEVLYTNAGIEAGIKPVSLLFSVGSNFHLTTWHIGLQSGAIRLWPWKIPVHITAGYSPLSATIKVDSGVQQTISFTAKGQLYDLGVTAYQRHGKHWLFKVSLDTRLLKTSYYKNGTLTAPGRYFPLTEDPDKILYLLRPPLKFVNTFDRNSATNIKLWPGISIGFYYSFF